MCSPHIMIANRNRAKRIQQEVTLIMIFILRFFSKDFGSCGRLLSVVIIVSFT